MDFKDQDDRGPVRTNPLWSDQPKSSWSLLIDGVQGLDPVGFLEGPVTVVDLRTFRQCAGAVVRWTL